ncbi:unnamed protein product [Discosporangium mesarthrocarpum]
MLFMSLRLEISLGSPLFEWFLSDVVRGEGHFESHVPPHKFVLKGKSLPFLHTVNCTLVKFCVRDLSVPWVFLHTLAALRTRQGMVTWEGAGGEQACGVENFVAGENDDFYAVCWALPGGKCYTHHAVRPLPPCADDHPPQNETCLILTEPLPLHALHCLLCRENKCPSSYP